MPPYQPRHSRRWPCLPDPSDVLFLTLTACTLLAACLAMGGLAAHPF